MTLVLLTGLLLGARAALLIVAGRALLRATTFPPGRLRRRQIMLGAVGLVGAVGAPAALGVWL